jgi:hypothetical protein
MPCTPGLWTETRATKESNRPLGWPCAAPPRRRATER